MAIFAGGPFSHLFHTTHEQTHVAYVMAYSACIGPYRGFGERCGNNPYDASGEQIKSIVRHIAKIDYTNLLFCREWSAFKVMPVEICIGCTSQPIVRDANIDAINLRLLDANRGRLNFAL